MKKSIDVAWWVGQALKDTTTRYMGVTAGMGAGKTHGREQWHIRNVILNRQPKEKAPLYSGQLWPNYQKIQDTAFPVLRKVAPEFGLQEDRDFYFVKSPFPKTIFTGLRHEIHYLSAESPQTIAAVEFGFGSTDEAGIISREARDNFQSRIRDPRSKHRQTLEVGVPQGLTAFAEIFDSDTLPGWIKDSQFRSHKPGPIGYRRFRLRTKDNPHVPPDYMDILVDIYGHNPQLLKSYVEGIFCDLVVGGAYGNYYPQAHDIEDIDPEPYRDIVMTWDFNANPLAWVALQKIPYEEPRGRIYRHTSIHEAEGSNSQIDDSCVEFASRFSPTRFGDTRIRVFGDRTGHAGSHKISGSDFENIYKYLTHLGFRNVEICATKRVAPEQESVDAVNRLFLNDLLYVCKRCKRLRKSLTATKWKEGTRKLDKPSGETWTHHSDSLKYWAWQETREETGHKTQPILGKSIF